MPIIFGNNQVTLGNVANLPMPAARRIIRFISSRSGRLDRMATCWRAGEFGHVNKVNPETGRVSWSYSAGDGGTYHVTLQGDMNGRPDGNVLDEFKFHVDLKSFPSSGRFGANNQYRVQQWMRKYLISCGTPYNIVFENIDPRPDENYCSLNGVFSRDKNYDAGFQVNSLAPNGRFTANVGSLQYFPQWSIRFDDGKVIGQPFQYGDAWTGQHRIHAGSMVRQDLVLHEPARLRQLAVCGTRLLGRDALCCTILINDRFHSQKWLRRFPLNRIPRKDGKRMLSGRNDYDSYAWRSIPVNIDVDQHSTIGFLFSTSGSNQFYIPASVRAGDYTGIQSADLTTPGSARYSDDGGRDWNHWKVNKRHNPNAMLSLYCS